MLYMNKRTSRNKHKNGYQEDVNGNKNYLRNVISIIISILIVGGVGAYLKNRLSSKVCGIS